MRIIALLFELAKIIVADVCAAVFGVLKKIRGPVFSALHALFLLVVSYLWLNLPFDYDAGEEHLTFFSFIKEQFKRENKLHSDFDSIVFVNIAYDKILVPVNDAIGMPVGHVPITDRDKLNQFLNILSQSNKQKAIFMDIDFSEEFPQDSVLAASMSATQNLFIPVNSNSFIGKASVQMGEVSGMKTLVSGDFFKYPYIFRERKSIPVKLYEYLDGGKFEKDNFVYYRNGKLAFNSIVPNYYFREFPKYSAEGIYNYYDLGADLLPLGKSAIEETVNGKLVLVGAFAEDDQHDTFVGRIPGILILLNAYYNLKYGTNEISYWLILILFLTYLFLTINALENWVVLGLGKFQQWLTNHKVLGLMVRLASFAGIFIVLSAIIKLLFNVYLNILLMGIYFAVFGSVVQYYKTKRK